MPLFWLAYRQADASCVLIVEAYDLLTARLRAEVTIPGINARFAEGHELDQARAAHVPAAAIGGVLEASEARRLLDRLDALTVPKKPPAPSVQRLHRRQRGPGSHRCSTVVEGIA